MKEMHPAEVMNSPYMMNQTLLERILIPLFMQTMKKPEPRKVFDTAVGGKKMRETKGPIKAEKAKKIASRRDAIMKDIP